MSQSVDEDMNSTLERVEMAAIVRGIFDSIVNEPIKQLQMRLEFIKENRFGDVWRDDTERHEKVMSHARDFMQTISASFPCKHAEAAGHIEKSICDLFLEYVYEVLHNSLLSENLFHDSYNETKELISRKIWKIKESLEAKHDERPDQKSELEMMISKTDLFDPIHIHHALLCCQIAYNCQNPEYIEKCLKNLEKEHLLSQLSVSYENEHVPKYVMARCGNVLYVSFKGMKSHIISGTNSSYRGDICKDVLSAAEKIPLKYFARAFINKQRIVFSGHSTGGAIACLVLTFLLAKFKQLEKSYLESHLQCITFGLIPMADIMFRKYVEAIPGAQSCFSHVVQKDDIVPKLFGMENIDMIENEIWELVEHVVKRPLEILSTEHAFSNVSVALDRVLKFVRNFGRSILRGYFNRERFDPFGTYYVMDASASDEKYYVVPAEKSQRFFMINNDEYPSIWDVLRKYLINTITGTTDQKRTTVPLIYNLDQNIMGLDVIDFPGVDDRDKSIPELANLLLSLTRIIIFVVDYRRAHTESTKKWLSILEKEKVPVLVCLTFADKLYAELMGENGDWNAENVKAGVENQFKTIKEQIGPTKHGHQRDLKLTVFAFDNDSKLNTEEGKEKLRKAGLSDELDVGRWIAEKLEDCGQNDVSQNVIRFIEGKEKSTLNSNVNRLSPVAEPATERENGDVQSVQGREGTIGQNPSLSQSGNE
ncbi:uncharacterized protein LOC114534202 isoform X1 [Dendronephthya gigantea]|uniref:uncharacterized protein LOC114534202 isoform X1 n=1 Tax=Dendronephthya gigantea TaxID=151771 RepID=UPI001068DE97|nr:uncharacterized protein LOC114534202 isoform X1 [Dendronephthya gigantea]